MLVDDSGDPALRTSAMLARSMIEHGLVGRGVACHARAVGNYPVEDQDELAGLAREAGLGFVSDPHTGPLALPVERFVAAGVDVALGQDDIEDAYYPYGRRPACLACRIIGSPSAVPECRDLDLIAVFRSL